MTMTITPYQAKWPNEILAKCYNDAKGNIEGTIYNLQAYAAPSWRGPTYACSWLAVQPRQPSSNAEESRQGLLGMSPYSQEIYVSTPDEVKLHGILAPGKYWTNKAILFCNSRSTPMEEKAWEYLQIAREAGCTGLVFNHRGVGKSKGYTSPNGQALDGYAMFDYLVNQLGFNPNDIICYGASQGGGTACEVAAMAQKQYPWASINHISERSFSSVAEAGYDWHIPKFGINWGIPRVVVDGVLYLGNASNFLNAKEAVKSLKGRVFIIYHEQDNTIPYSSSLNKNIQLANCCAKEIIRLQLVNDDPNMIGHDNHVRQLTAPEKMATQMVIRKMFNIPDLSWAVPDYVKARLTVESRLNHRTEWQ